MDPLVMLPRLSHQPRPRQTLSLPKNLLVNVVPHLYYPSLLKSVDCVASDMKTVVLDDKLLQRGESTAFAIGTNLTVNRHGDETELRIMRPLIAC